MDIIVVENTRNELYLWSIILLSTKCYYTDSWFKGPELQQIMSSSFRINENRVFAFERTPNRIVHFLEIRFVLAMIRTVKSDIVLILFFDFNVRVINDIFDGKDRLRRTVNKYGRFFDDVSKFGIFADQNMILQLNDFARAFFIDNINMPTNGNCLEKFDKIAKTWLSKSKESNNGPDNSRVETYLNLHVLNITAASARKLL